MNKKRFYINHPFINSSGSYTFKDGNNSNEYQNSDSVPLRFDKFRRNDLYTTSTGDNINEKIIQSYFDEKNGILNSDNTPITRLKYNSPSFVRIDSLFIDFNSNNLSGTVNDTMFYGFIANELALALNHDENVPDDTLDVHEQILNPTFGSGDYDGMGLFGRQLRPLKNADGSFKDWQSIYDIVFTQNDGSGGGPDLDGDRRTLDELGEFYQFDPPVLDDSKPEDVPGYVLQDAVILQGLNQGDVRQHPRLADTANNHANDDNYRGPEPDVFVHGDKSNIDNFRPKEIFYVGNTNTNTVTKIFDEGPGKQFNTIYFIFYLAGNKKGGGKKNKRFQIYEINPLDLFQTDIGGNVIGGKETTFDLGEGIIIDQTDHNQIPAFKITEFKVTINTLDGAGLDYNPNETYDSTIIESILPPQRSNPININRLDENILTINPYRELLSEPPLSIQPIPMEYTDFIPTSHIKIKNTSQDVQMYYDNEIERQTASAPTVVEIDFTISNTTTDKSQLKDRRTDIIGNEDNSNYFFTVVDWNDVDNKYETIQDVLNDFPTTMIELNNKRKDNLFYFNDIYKPLFNNYTTPGIKNIKTLLFNYTTDGNNNIEPTRWKLVTSRIFLDIPINQFPDFGEVGGGDYTTIPWPYTAPIIGGISNDSKYLKSIDDVLGGGKIGDSDIIDETFLVDAKENDELGNNVQVMDLEQIRYFNQSYDMNTLLNIPIENNFYPNPYTNIGSGSYWDGSTIERTFSEESSVGQIFISDNQDNDLKGSCQVELNLGNLTGKSIDDSSGNLNKGLMIGDYKIKKTQKNQPMRRDSFIKIPKKNNNSNGAL